MAAEAERVLATGRAEGLTGPLRLYPPEDAHSAWQVSERWVEWRTTSDAISVDGSTGEVIDRQPFSLVAFCTELHRPERYVCCVHVHRHWRQHP